MRMIGRWRAAAGGALVLVASLVLSACIVSPGKFAAALDLRRDGRFTFTYQGEIHLLALSKLAEMSSQSSGDDEFTPSACWDDNLDEHECTDEELAEQRETWEAGAAERKERAAREAEAMRQFLGGIDPADPKAAEEFAARLRRQEGWKRVDYRGDGLFEVDFALSSTLGHDFAFPTFERFPMTNTFVVANIRQGRTVRVEAPGFSAQGGANPFGSFASLAALGAASSASPESGLNLPQMDGTFRIVTDGQVLANNTDEGPQATAGGQVLEWRINQRTQSAPMALIQLGD
ncbi:MAG TPA: hypothetical protein VFS49_02705 [Croceibacterium sp.]|nr:hypothetical protein [Croceibacterium sp.]